MHYIDFHVHIDFYDNYELIMNDYEKNQIYTLFVTNLPELYAKHIKKVQNFKYVRLALGFHPEMITQYNFNKQIFKNYITTTKYIGEVGLDASIKHGDYFNKQYEILKYITQPCFSKGKIYSIHSRKCELDVLSILKSNNVKSAVFHWYSGSISNIKKIVEEGYYFSINVNMLRSKKGIDILKTIPKDRMLFETDGPFTKFKKKIITPNFIPKAYYEISKCIGMNPDNFRDLVFKNFKKLLIESQLKVLKK